MRLLLISNSTNPGEPYLDYPKNHIKEFLGNKPVTTLFIPYAAVTFSFNEYEARVSERFRETGHDVISIHRYSDPVDAVRNAQINPHYLDLNPPGHAGETREQRIIEFIELNPDIYVAGLREGSMLFVEDGKIRLSGPRNIRIFRKGSATLELGPESDLSFLLKQKN